MKNPFPSLGKGFFIVEPGHDDHMRILNRIPRFTVIALGVALVASTGSPAVADRSADVAVEWFDITHRTVTEGGAPTQITNSRTWAISWLAAARAVHRTPGGQRDRADAAVATAVHDALVALVPSRTTDLDAALVSTLDRIPDGEQRRLGIGEGRAQAVAVLRSREGDGLDPASVNPPIELPAPAPGVWRPTPTGFVPPQQAGNRLAKPFLLTSGAEVRLGPPPALDSWRSRADLAEVRAYGASDSAVRTPRQTETANFWYQLSQPGYVPALRAALVSSSRLVRRVDLVAAFNVVMVDAQIATSDSKYTYFAWRPVTAITTTVDPQWTPLHNTPAHPDYPSGHSTFSGAAEAILTAFVGPTARAPFVATSLTAPGVQRTYFAWHELTRDNVNARVWSGIHTRTADTSGATLGTHVAHTTLPRYPTLLT
jgi:hypothetical protein